MNKTLLLILVDFLLLNLLALTRWEEPPEIEPTSAMPAPTDTVQQIVEQDLVAELRVTLEEQMEARNALGQQLDETRDELAQREETLAEREQRLASVQAEFEQTQAEAAKLGQRMADSQATVMQLSDRLTETAEEAARSRTQAEQLARELQQQQAQAAALAESVTRLEQEKATAQAEAQALATEVKVATTEREFLRESVQTLRTQVVDEREENSRLQQQTGVLAQGVTQLAVNSADLREEIRSNTPINANTLFDGYRNNKVDASFHAARENFFGPVTRDYKSSSIIVTHDDKAFLLFHADGTPGTLKESPADWREIEGILRRGDQRVSAESLQFLVVDPRVVVVRLTAEDVAALGAKTYPTALEPFKFPEAVLIGGDGQYYGEVEFKLDPLTPGYVHMQSKVISRMFGEFSPSVGDLVFSKTGELLGVMVNRRYCALIDNFAVSGELPFGPDVSNQKTSEILAAMKARVERLPLRLQ